MKFVFLTLALFAHAALANGCDLATRTVVGDDAAQLAYVLKYSAYTTKTETSTTEMISIADVSCAQTSRGVVDDVMPTYFCQSPAQAGPLNSKILWDALAAIGVWGEGGMSKTYVEGQAITCTIDKDALDRVADPLTNSPYCTLTAVWADSCND